ncbi:MAG: alanine--tRNA ligase [Lentimicrobiaceae bacterium]|nr:alanine--tRNA ligase [Lentimicrobiaceae bacterium]
MNSFKIRQAFMDFFQGKGHEIVSSAPVVMKNDPTLLFINAGMNQFKDVFLGNSPVQYKRIANSQKCLRVSGKHNDLEEVGRDTYHHTLFEMLGNWSFGDYFKKEAIAWSWEFLTETMKINKENLYITVFGGDEKDGTEKDAEAYNLWKEIVSEDHILFGGKKDNFWEMGDAGPCGPCSEIHIDIRDEAEKTKTAGSELINKDHPQVIEIWNLVFIQYQRLANGKLELLPSKYVDTGMGFERLCMVLQGKQSNYDTDVFQPIIQEIAKLANTEYGQNEPQDIAMRVVADHLRAIAFAIADGQLPSNTGAGYVIRRILRRAVRYGFTFLHFDQAFIHQLLPVLTANMGDYFPELKKHKTLISKVIHEEEQSFLRTLSQGIQRFEHHLANNPSQTVINGDFAFELFDTYGFPIDLTQLMASEKNLQVDMDGFAKNLQQQKERSRAASTVETQDWVELVKDIQTTEFLGYDQLETTCKIVKYRFVKSKEKQFYQLVLDKTPFYAESGGQMGDKGILSSANDTISVVNTLKENNLTVHIVNQLPQNLEAEFVAKVDENIRRAIQCNHSATHLIHYALRQVLGTHVEQKGSSVDGERLRFDFSHFSKLSQEEIHQVEDIVNEMVKMAVPTEDFRSISMSEAENMGAMALFGEKYGKEVRVIKMGGSIELCGGTHVHNTGNIGLVKIQSESAIAAGVRRIEAITGIQTEKHIRQMEYILEDIKLLLHSPNITQSLQKLVAENDKVKKEMEEFAKERMHYFVREIENRIENFNGMRLIRSSRPASPDMLKQAAFHLRSKLQNIMLLFTSSADDKPFILVAFSDDLVEKGMDANKLIKAVSALIQGGGGGQAGLASAGGKNIAGLEQAAEKIMEMMA